MNNYFVNVVYEYFNITTTVEADNDEQAVDVALQLLSEELGQAVYNFIATETMEEDN